MKSESVTDFEDVMSLLRAMDGVRNVSDGSTSMVPAIDFEVFKLKRPTNTSNFVFSRMGTSFEGGLLRLPRVKKSEYTSDEIEDVLLQCIPPAFHQLVDIRLEPETDLDESYHYLHIYMDGSLRDALHITEAVAADYVPLY